LELAENRLAERFRSQDRRALSRALTLASRGELGAQLAQFAVERPARVLAFSGSGGVGKSSLIGRMVEWLRQRGETVAVLACDPESAVTGGSLLGDRVRISPPGADPGVFIRSLATPAGRQAVAPNLNLMIRVLRDYGFQNIILETVGAGQGDTAVRALADVLVVLLQPETGDELQWEKAGLLEVADVVVVHKSDLPGAEKVEAQVREQLNLPGSRPVPVISASANRREGIDQIWNAVQGDRVTR
jgi:LAO/AO transport system ATPase